MNAYQEKRSEVAGYLRDVNTSVFSAANADDPDEQDAIRDVHAQIDKLLEAYVDGRIDFSDIKTDSTNDLVQLHD